MIEAAVRRRQPLPDAVQNAPSLLPGLELYLEAYMDLATCRSTAFAVERVPWTAIDQYARRNGIDGEAFDYFLALMREMDQEYIDWMNDKSKRDREAKT